MPKNRKTSIKRNSTKLTKPNPFYRRFISTQTVGQKTGTPGGGPISRMAKRKLR